MKKLNLIKRLLSYSHEKQKMGGMRRYAAMLMMLLTLGVGQMWGNIKFYYGETTDQVYLHIWNAGSSDNTTWSNKKSMTKVPGTTNVWYYEMHDNDNDFYVIFCKSQNKDGKFNDNNIHITPDCNGKKYTSSGTSGSSYTPPTVYSVTVSTESSLKGTISAPASSPTSVVEDGSLTITASEKSGYYFTSWTASPAGNATFANANKISTTATITGNVTITAHFTNSLQEALIAGSYIMVYGGERVDWSQSTYYFMTENNTSKAVASPTMSGTYYIHDNSTKYEFGAATLSPGTYYQGHWASNLSCEVTAGHAYVVQGKGESTGTYYTSKQQDGDNGLYEVIKAGSTAPTYRVSTTIDAEVICGGNISVSSGDPGVSSIGLPNSLVYYLYNGSTWSTLTVSEGVANVSALSVGEGYKIVTFLYDGHIYVKADEDEFEVIEATGHTITYTPQSTGWTYGTKPSAAEVGDEVTFVVTPTAGYSVTVSSEDVVLSGPNASYEYTFTMPDGDVDIDVSATENTYTVTLINATEDEVTAGCATHPSITASEAPFGMKFDHWDVSGGADVASKTSSTTTVSATAAGTVTAVYVQSLYAYIVGRFETHSKDRQSTYYTGNWNTKATNNEFEYDETNHRFVKHTYTTLAELSANKDSNPQYFEIKTTEDHGDLSDASVKYYGKTDNTDITTAGSSYKIAMEQSTVKGHPKFSGSTTDKYVVIYLDKDYNLWFEEEDIPAAIDEVDLSVTRVPPTAPITATPTMYVRGAVNKAYCWGVYTDADCTSKVNSVTFSSLGDGKVQFMAPQTRGTYYLKLTVHSSDDCNAAIDDEEVVSFTVTTDDMVFFKNVPGWGNVHVYFLGASPYWNERNGAGCQGRDWGYAHGMTRIGNSDIYYYDYHGNSNAINGYIAFTDNYKPNSEFFSGCQGVYRRDFNTCAPMYVPENYITHYMNTSAGDGQCAYYNRGYWTNYMSVNSGFTLHVYDKVTGEASQVFEHEFTGIAGRNTYTYTYTFTGEKTYTYGFKVEGCGGSWYGLSNNTMNINSCTNYNLYTDNNNCGLEITANLPHTFIFTLTGDGHVQMSIDYPLAVGDYRLVYSDDTHTAHPSRYIRARANGKDTISMWVNKDATDPILKVQKCTSTNPITWVDYNWGDGASPRIDISTCTAGVYNFYLEQDGSSELDVKTTETIPYVGSYYIRTNSVDGGWISYKTAADNRMTYSQYSYDQGYGFDYYKTKWVSPSGSNVTYTIACDYSESLCDTLTADPNDDPLNASQASSIPQAANVRFGWNSKTNKLKRAYISGSTNISDRFLVLVGDAKMLDKNGNALTGVNQVAGLGENEMNFTDLGNWIYRADIKAIPGAQVQLTAEYDNQTQYFIGTEEKPETIIGGDGGTPRLMRVTYDFKTNRLMTAWLPNGSAIDENMTLKADMMLIREGQNAATQVYFGESHKNKTISEIKTIFGVMEFQYDHIAGKFPNWSAANAYKYLMYYISFPFDVKVSEIFGAGVRGENWIIQKYNGAKRAKIGWFAETSTFWETLPGDSTLHANEGYLLLLDRITFNDPSSSIWYKQGSGNSVYLYFPSVSNSIGTIKDADEDAVVHIPSHVCSINRTFEVNGVSVNHKNTDSHWNVFGPPVFQSKAATTVGTPVADGAGGTDLKYFYSWNYSNNTLRTKVALAGDTVFKSMHGYMVQYAGDVTFTGAHIAPPAPVAARRLPSDKKYLIELQLMNESEEVNATYVELRENACDTFVLNEDMYMMRTSNTVDLYSFAGGYDVAANVLSVNSHVVPVGLDVLQAGTYRFTMPSEFSGTVTLIDTETGVRTNLALSDYEVALPKGTLNTRFLLEIDIHQMPTAIDGVDGGSLKDGKAHKFIENGQMYILQNGIIYDAQGKRVK